MSKYILYALYSLVLQGIIFFGMYVIVQPDPKGIGFFIFSFGYGLVCVTACLILLYVRNSYKIFLYYFFMIGDCIFWFYLVQLLEQIREFPPLQLNLLHILTVFGCLLFLGLVGNLIANFQSTGNKVP